MTQDTERGDLKLVIGYVRWSTEEQNEERQLQMMKEHHAEKIFMDKRSGKNADREKYKEMMSFVHEGDMIFIDIPNCRLEVKVSDEELAARKAKWTAPEPKIKSGYAARYAKLVSSADKGAVLA